MSNLAKINVSDSDELRLKKINSNFKSVNTNSKVTTKVIETGVTNEEDPTVPSWAKQEKLPITSVYEDTVSGQVLDAIVISDIINNICRE